MTTGYIICTTPRSGSTLLCTLLEATGQAGQPDSFYHEPHVMKEWADAWALPDACTIPSADYEKAYLEAALAAGRGTTSMFGLRLQQAHLVPLIATLARLFPDCRSDLQRLERAFGSLRYLHLKRCDKVAQAVSLVKARQSGLWHRHADGRERERNGPASQLVYDPVAIEAEVAKLTQADQTWEQWFAQEQIEPILVTYEAFAQRSVETVCDICATLGTDPVNPQTISPGVAKLSDAINVEWVARYHSDSARRNDRSRDC